MGNPQKSQDDNEAQERRRDDALRRALAMPPKKHKESAADRKLRELKVAADAVLSDLASLTPLAASLRRRSDHSRRE
jgi:hypothetical protein